MNGKSKKNKVAWSDDLSYDSEEEREKELALAELAEIETPEKPSYSDDDLNKLVSFIKRMTTLCQLKQEDWNDECIDVIKQFFMEPKCPILFVFYTSGKLTATLNIPEVSVSDLTYFIRDPDMIFSVENFHDEVTFGTVVKNVEESLLKLLECVYAPAFITTTLLPENVKNEFLSNLHAFLSKLKDSFYSKMGLTVFYVPIEGLDFSVTEASTDSELTKRLENVVVYWIQNIKSFIEDNIMITVQNELLCPTDELDFWIYRYENLSTIKYQVQNPKVVHISNILKNTSSSYIEQFKRLCSQVEICMDEAKSNIEYLQIIKEPCNAMENEKNPEELPKHIPHILNMFRFIWTKSPYYNTEARMTTLCHYLSHQVIIQCSASIDLISLFKGNTRKAIEEIQKCIDCCKSYRDIYDSVSDAHNTVKPGSWNLNTNIIFNSTTSFIDRCVDLLEVCNGMIIFGRIDEVEEKPKPVFRGTNGEKFERVCKMIETTFNNALSKIEKAKDEILAIQASNWYNHITKFRKTTKYIEMLIQNLLTTIFETVNNIEEGIQVLCSTYLYSKRKNLNQFFIKKTADVWSMFGKEIENVKKDIVAERECYPKWLPPYSGQVVALRMRKNYLFYLKKVMDAAIWLLPCNNSNIVLNQYKELITVIDETIKNIWNSWIQTVDEKLENGLNRSLVSRSIIHSGLLECNFDRNIMAFYQEAKNFDNIAMEIPQNGLKLYGTMNNMKMMYDGILSLVIQFNRVQMSLSDQERALFKPLSNISKNKIENGLFNLTWSSPNINNYISECAAEIKELQRILINYKQSNRSIKKLLEQICDCRLIILPPLKSFDLEELKMEIQNMWTTAMENILLIYKEINKNMSIIFKGFEDHIEKISMVWIEFVKHIDSLLEFALRLNIRSTLKHVYTRINGDGSVEPHPLLNTKTILKENVICLIPSQQEINDVLSNILPGIIKIFTNIPRLHEKCNLPYIGLKKFHEVIENDAECKQIQKCIISEINATANKICNHIKTWNSFKHIWLLSKEEFLENYVSLNPSARDFDKDMLRYIDLANDVQMRASMVQLKFLLVDNSLLKTSIIKHCTEWQDKFGSALKDCAKRDINALFSYIKRNSDAIMRRPTTLIELQDSVDAYDKLCAEILQKEKEISDIKDNMEMIVQKKLEISPDVNTLYGKIKPTWIDYTDLLDDSKRSLKKYKEEFKNNLLKDAETFKNRTASLIIELKRDLPKSHNLKSADAQATLQKIRESINAQRDIEIKLIDDLRYFNLSMLPNIEIRNMNKEVDDLYEVWNMVEKWENTWDNYKYSKLWHIEVIDMEDEINSMCGIFNKLLQVNKGKDVTIINKVNEELEVFRKTTPLIQLLKNPHMKKRHWDEIKEVVKIDFDFNSNDFNLESIISMDFQNYSNIIAEISNAATIEHSIEKGLKTITDIWDVTMFGMELLENNVYKICKTEDCMQYFEDHQVQLSVMKSTKYVAPLIDQVEYWEKALGATSECIELALQVQRRWLYLESIVKGEDIKKQLKNECQIFSVITSDWKMITNRMHESRNAIEACQFEPLPYLIDKLNELIDKLDKMLYQLESYLELKRQLFPRFYFISNDDLLEILGNSDKPQMIQLHLKKLFDSFNKMEIEKNKSGLFTAKAMISAEGEIINWKNPVILAGPAEEWLKNLEDNMKSTLKQVLVQTRIALRSVGLKRESWIKDWPGQLLITTSKIQWTSDCIRFLQICKIGKSKRYLKKLRKRQNQILQTLLKIIRDDITKVLRLKVNALAVIEIHSRDVVDKLYKMNCIDASSFEWFSQLKFFWDRNKEDCFICQTDTTFPFTYEYIGNTGRLVITPLTERCYITLTMALHLFRGGSLQGPAGTGKTETVKDLGRAMARWVVITNCSEGLDYKSMEKCFSGIAQSGCWGCFDEFNRINIEVLSVVAQQISSILTAISKGVQRFNFGGFEINLKTYCGIFITMNPGYAGRTELPDNLKSMFRPISMCVPDNLIIAEITLFSDGFQDYKLNAKKVFTLYELSKIKLSKQYHYDFGLRSMVALLRYAGIKRRVLTNLSEEQIVILAMRDMNITRLTARDVPLFDGLLKDIFPECPRIEVDNTFIQNAIINELQLDGLQSIPIAVEKVMQLMDTKNSRHSTMLLGDTNTAKSTTWRILKKTYINLKEKCIEGFEYVHCFPINPKTLTLAELYGEYNLSTGEWADGIISSVMREVCKDETPDQKWLLFDGPVDAIWIENLNSVMDDNKLLTLINSERISMPPMVSLLFEAQDLAVASPATVSRCGIVYNDYNNWGWRPYVKSWLNTIKHDKKRESFQKLFDNYLDRILNFKRLNLIEGPGSESQELSAVRELCCLLSTLYLSSNVSQENVDDAYRMENANKVWFLFCVVWSIGATLDGNSCAKFDIWLRELENIFPLKMTVYDYYVDERSFEYVPWEERLSKTWTYNLESGFHNIIVPTVEFIRIQNISEMLIKSGVNVLVGGPMGGGKTSLLKGLLNTFDNEKYIKLIINMSASTTSTNLQETIETRLEKRSRGKYVPSGNKTLIAFIDDLNMPSKDEYGSQPPLELLRQYFDYGFWYDREKQYRKEITGMVILGGVGVPGGARSHLPSRLLSCFHSFFLPSPSQTQLIKIFDTIASQHFVQFHDESKSIGKLTVTATIHLYDCVINKLLPTPAKLHYVFNLRDLSKIFQGVLRSDKNYHSSKNCILRLWVHEEFRVFYDRLINQADRDWFVQSLNETLEKYFNITLSSLCPNKEYPIFGDFMNEYKLYEDITNLDDFKTFSEIKLKEYNMSAGAKKMDLPFIKETLENIAKIARVISQARGHMLLIGSGGSGRRSLARLVSYICNYKSFEVNVTKNYELKDFREDIKSLYMSTGVENRNTTFIFNDMQIIDERFCEIINNLLSTGEIVNLFKMDEFENIKSLLEKRMKQAKIVQTNENTYNFLLERVCKNMHIVFGMSPIGEKFRNRIRRFPSFINNTTIVWLFEMPKEALYEVAYKYLSNSQIPVYTINDENEKSSVLVDMEKSMKSTIANLMSIIHISACDCNKRMLQEINRTNYVTLSKYIYVFTDYERMTNKKYLDIKSKIDKFSNGLAKLEEAKKSIEVMTVELGEAKVQNILRVSCYKVQVSSYTNECIKYMETLNEQKQNVDEQRKAVGIKSEKTAEEEIECRKLADAAMKDLEIAMPALQDAISALNSLNKKDITEIKSYAKPPHKIEMVLEAVMILLQFEPTWTEAKRQIGDQYFLENLRNFDKDHISDKVLRKISLYTSNSDFEPEAVGTVSLAAKSLCLWVRAIEKYGKVFKVVKPKREHLGKAMDSLHLKQQILIQDQKKLQDLTKTINELQIQYDEKYAQKEELTEKANNLQLKLDRAATLVDNLGGEKGRWEDTVKMLEIELSTLPGDCLLASTFVAYMGPFPSEYREDLFGDWSKMVTNAEIPYRFDFDIKSFMLSDLIVRKWSQHGLPGDNFSIENGIIVKYGNNVPLIIDPQDQALAWISHMEKENNIQILEFDHADFSKILQTSLVEGVPVLIKNVSEDIDPIIDPILNKTFVHVGNRIMIEFNQQVVDFNAKFSLYLTTKQGNPKFSPDTLRKTSLVNFSIKEKGLQDQLLGIVIQKEMPKLEEMKNNLVINIAKGKKTLVDLEDELLQMMRDSAGSLLDNTEFFQTLQISKITSLEVNEGLKTSQSTEKEIDTARKGYVPVAERSASLFFVLNELSQIDPMYQFSLDAYLGLFKLSIERSTKSDILEERIKYLNDYHTNFVHKYTCRALFEKHKLVFTFYMLMKVNNKISTCLLEYQFLLKGGIVLNKEEQALNTVDWIPENCWDNITELDKLPGFSGIRESFETYSEEWLVWYIHPEPETQPLIGKWESACDDFKRLLVLRCLRLDRLTSSITIFIMRNFGENFVASFNIDLKVILEESNERTPVLFILSSGVNPSAAILQLADDCGTVDNMKSLSLGQGQSVYASRLLEDGMKNGGWVFLANCHLACAWLSTFRGLDLADIHPKFRLWLSSMPDPKFPLGILQKSIKITTEPPKGLKANMSNLFMNVNSNAFNDGTLAYRRLLFCISFFHSTLIARKRFRQLGYNIIYNFSDADFKVSEHVLSVYMEKYKEIPWDTLKYLFAVINYGGHVTDNWDMRILNAYINHILSSNLIRCKNYKLSDSNDYYIPDDGSIDIYKTYIDSLPMLETAESIGQHITADVASQAQDAKIMCDALFSISFNERSVDSAGNDEKVNTLVSTILLKLPDVINIESTERLMGSDNVLPLCVILLQELVYYNNLIDDIRGNLKELRLAFEGLIVMSENLEIMYKYIFEGKVPSIWTKIRPSMKSLGSWCRELSERGLYLATWAKSPLNVPNVHWLAALNYPTGLLAAIMQTVARKKGWPIDTLCWEFEVANSDICAEMTLLDHNCVFVRDLYLEGADWSNDNMHLIEPHGLQLICKMPLIKFGVVQGSGKKSKRKYLCPTYYYPMRSGTFIVGVELPLGNQDSDFWIKRGVALLSTLAD